MKDSNSQCMCGGGEGYHSAKKILKNLKSEIDAAKRYLVWAMDDPEISLDFREKIYKEATALGIILPLPADFSKDGNE